MCAAAILNSYVIYKMIINFQAKDTVTMVTSLCKSALHENNVKLKLMCSISVLIVQVSVVFMMLKPAMGHIVGLISRN